MTLEPYSREPRHLACPKCGRTLWDIEWHPFDHEERPDDIADGMFCPKPRSEHLHWKCNCGYAKVTKTRDT